MRISGHRISFQRRKKQVGTFQRTETIDARQFQGGALDGANLALWVNGNGSALQEVRANWRRALALGGRTLPDSVRVQSTNYDRAAYPTDWIVLTQEGNFVVMSDNEFLEAGYVQV